MNGKLHLIKLSVGSNDVESLIEWQDKHRKALKRDTSLHITRMWPKREAELLSGGSIYWVIKGSIQARQRIIRFDEVIGEDGIRRCGMVLDRELVRTRQAIRRPFQGWRYLRADDAPPDIAENRINDSNLPPTLQEELEKFGLL